MLMIRLARFGAKKKPFYRIVVILGFVVFGSTDVEGPACCRLDGGQCNFIAHVCL